MRCLWSSTKGPCAGTIPVDSDVQHCQRHACKSPGCKSGKESAATLCNVHAAAPLVVAGVAAGALTPLGSIPGGGETASGNGAGGEPAEPTPENPFEADIAAADTATNPFAPTETMAPPSEVGGEGADAGSTADADAQLDDGGADEGRASVEATLAIRPRNDDEPEQCTWKSAKGVCTNMVRYIKIVICIAH